MERVFLRGNGGVGRQKTEVRRQNREYRSQKSESELALTLTLSTRVQEYRSQNTESELALTTDYALSLTDIACLPLRFRK
jgi:hypothetical protein